MNKNKTLELAEAISKLLWSGKHPKRLQASSFFFMREGVTLYFSKEHAQHYRYLRSSILKETALTNSYSTKALIEKLQTFLVELYKEGSIPKADVSKRLAVWIENLKKAPSAAVTYRFVVENLRLQDPISLGNFRLKNLNQKVYLNIKKELKRRVSSNKHYSAKEKMDLFDSLTKTHIVNYMPNGHSALATTRIDTKDIEFGYRVAHENLKDLLSILHFIGRDARTPYYELGLRGEVSDGHETAFITSKQGFQLKFQSAHHPFTLNPRVVSRLQKRGLDWYSHLSKKTPSSRSKIENVVINAATWIGNSSVESSEKEQFLKLCIALESLMVGEGEMPFGLTIGDRIGFLLGNSSEERKEISNKFRKIYNIRSKIAHEGKAKRETDVTEYLPWVSAYAHATIDKIQSLLVDKKWFTLVDLYSYLDEFKYS